MPRGQTRQSKRFARSFYKQPVNNRALHSATLHSTLSARRFSRVVFHSASKLNRDCLQYGERREELRRIRITLVWSRVREARKVPLEENLELPAKKKKAENEGNRFILTVSRGSRS